MQSVSFTWLLTVSAGTLLLFHRFGAGFRETPLDSEARFHRSDGFQWSADDYALNAFRQDL
jgi:hypothetical protein